MYNDKRKLKKKKNNTNIHIRIFLNSLSTDIQATPELQVGYNGSLKQNKSKN